MVRCSSRQRRSLQGSVAARGDDDEMSALSDYPDTSDDDEYQVARPPPKKRRISAESEKGKKAEQVQNKRRSLRDVLEDLWGLPLDIVYEIFGHLMPLDLLHLARTNKYIRGLLLTRSATSVWIQARSHIEGLPDCPLDISEPEYANLVFDPYCHYCNATNVQTIIWEARVRCCKRCGPVVFNYWINIPDMPDIIQCLVPSTHEFTSGKIHPWTEKKYSALIAVNLKGKLNAQNEDDKPKWLWNEKKKFDARVEHAKMCEKFIESRSSNRVNELDDARRRRREAIIQKLTERGWGEEIDKMSNYQFSTHNHVKVPKDLTDRAWNKIEADMIAFLQEARDQRLQQERNKGVQTRCNLLKEMYASFVADQPVHAILPGVGDFATIPEFKTILENPHPGEVPVTLADFQIGDGRLAEFAENWRKEKDDQLLGILRQSSIGAEASKSILSLATTLFNCKTCSAPVSYPRILVHTCNLSRSYDMPDPTTVFERLKAEPWNLGGDRISFHEAAHKRGKHILKALGMKPLTTFDEITEVNPFVECFCAICYKPGSFRTMARWNRMIEHTPRYTATNVSRPYGVLDCRRTSLARKLETVELTKVQSEHHWDDYSHRSYYCPQCKTRDTHGNIKHHMVTKHQIPAPRFAIHYTFHLDAKIKLRAPFITFKVVPKEKTNASASASST